MKTNRKNKILLWASAGLMLVAFCLSSLLGFLFPAIKTSKAYNSDAAAGEESTNPATILLTVQKSGDAYTDSNGNKVYYADGYGVVYCNKTIGLIVSGTEKSLATDAEFYREYRDGIYYNQIEIADEDAFANSLHDFDEDVKDVNSNVIYYNNDYAYIYCNKADKDTDGAEFFTEMSGQNYQSPINVDKKTLKAHSYSNAVNCFEYFDGTDWHELTADETNSTHYTYTSTSTETTYYIYINGSKAYMATDDQYSETDKTDLSFVDSKDNATVNSIYISKTAFNAIQAQINNGDVYMISDVVRDGSKTNNVVYTNDDYLSVNGLTIPKGSNIYSDGTYYFVYYAHIQYNSPLYSAYDSGNYYKGYVKNANGETSNWTVNIFNINNETKIIYGDLTEPISIDTNDTLYGSIGSFTDANGKHYVCYNDILTPVYEPGTDIIDHFYRGMWKDDIVNIYDTVGTAQYDTVGKSQVEKVYINVNYITKNSSGEKTHNLKNASGIYGTVASGFVYATDKSASHVLIHTDEIIYIYEGKQVALSDTNLMGYQVDSTYYRVEESEDNHWYFDGVAARPVHSGKYYIAKNQLTNDFGNATDITTDVYAMETGGDGSWYVQPIQKITNGSGWYVKIGTGWKPLTASAGTIKYPNIDNGTIYTYTHTFTNSENGQIFYYYLDETGGNNVKFTQIFNEQPRTEANNTIFANYYYVNYKTTTPTNVYVPESERIELNLSFSYDTHYTTEMLYFRVDRSANKVYKTNSNFEGSEDANLVVTKSAATSNTPAVYHNSVEDTFEYFDGKNWYPLVVDPTNNSHFTFCYNYVYIDEVTDEYFIATDKTYQNVLTNLTLVNNALLFNGENYKIYDGSSWQTLAVDSENEFHYSYESNYYYINPNNATYYKATDSTYSSIDVNLILITEQVNLLFKVSENTYKYSNDGTAWVVLIKDTTTYYSSTQSKHGLSVGFDSYFESTETNPVYVESNEGYFYRISSRYYFSANLNGAIANQSPVLSSFCENFYTSLYYSADGSNKTGVSEFIYDEMNEVVANNPFFKSDYIYYYANEGVNYVAPEDLTTGYNYYIYENSEYTGIKTENVASIEHYYIEADPATRYYLTNNDSSISTEQNANYSGENGNKDKISSSSDTTNYDIIISVGEYGNKITGPAQTPYSLYKNGSNTAILSGVLDGNSRDGYFLHINLKSALIAKGEASEENADAAIYGAWSLVIGDGNQGYYVSVNGLDRGAFTTSMTFSIVKESDYYTTEKMPKLENAKAIDTNIQVENYYNTTYLESSLPFVSFDTSRFRINVKFTPTSSTSSTTYSITRINPTTIRVSNGTTTKEYVLNENTSDYSKGFIFYLTKLGHYEITYIPIQKTSTGNYIDLILSNSGTYQDHFNLTNFGYQLQYTEYSAGGGSARKDFFAYEGNLTTLEGFNAEGIITLDDIIVGSKNQQKSLSSEISAFDSDANKDSIVNMAVSTNQAPATFINSFSGKITDAYYYYKSNISSTWSDAQSLKSTDFFSKAGDYIIVVKFSSPISSVAVTSTQYFAFTLTNSQAEYTVKVAEQIYNNEGTYEYFDGNIWQTLTPNSGGANRFECTIGDIPYYFYIDENTETYYKTTDSSYNDSLSTPLYLTVHKNEYGNIESGNITNGNVVIKISEKASQFDVKPQIVIKYSGLNYTGEYALASTSNAGVETDTGASMNGNYILNASSISFSDSRKYIVSLYYGPNVWNGHETYVSWEFTIDKNAITYTPYQKGTPNSVELADNEFVIGGNDNYFYLDFGTALKDSNGNIVTDESGRTIYIKNSGAKISASYVYTPIVLDEDTLEVNALEANSTTYITTKYKLDVASKSTFAVPYGRGSIILCSNPGLYEFEIVDEAGNRSTYFIFLDNVSPEYIVQNLSNPTVIDDINNSLYFAGGHYNYSDGTEWQTLTADNGSYVYDDMNYEYTHTYTNNSQTYYFSIDTVNKTYLKLSDDTSVNLTLIPAHSIYLNTNGTETDSDDYYEYYNGESWSIVADATSAPRYSLTWGDYKAILIDNYNEFVAPTKNNKAHNESSKSSASNLNNVIVSIPGDNNYIYSKITNFNIKFYPDGDKATTNAENYPVADDGVYTFTTETTKSFTDEESILPGYKNYLSITSKDYTILKTKRNEGTFIAFVTDAFGNSGAKQAIKYSFDLSQTTIYVKNNGDAVSVYGDNYPSLVNNTSSNLDEMFIQALTEGTTSYGDWKVQSIIAKFYELIYRNEDQSDVYSEEAETIYVYNIGPENIADNLSDIANSILKVINADANGRTKEGKYVITRTYQSDFSAPPDKFEAKLENGYAVNTSGVYYFSSDNNKKYYYNDGTTDVKYFYIDTAEEIYYQTNSSYSNEPADITALTLVTSKTSPVANSIFYNDETPGNEFFEYFDGTNWIALTLSTWFYSTFEPVVDNATITSLNNRLEATGGTITRGNTVYEVYERVFVSDDGETYYYLDGTDKVNYVEDSDDFKFTISKKGIDTDEIVKTWNVFVDRTKPIDRNATYGNRYVGQSNNLNLQPLKEGMSSAENLEFNEFVFDSDTICLDTNLLPILVKALENKYDITNNPYNFFKLFITLEQVDVKGQWGVLDGIQELTVENFLSLHKELSEGTYRITLKDAVSSTILNKDGQIVDPNYVQFVFKATKRAPQAEFKQNFNTSGETTIILDNETDFVVVKPGTNVTFVIDDPVDYFQAKVNPENIILVYNDGTGIKTITLEKASGTGFANTKYNTTSLPSDNYPTDKTRNRYYITLSTTNENVFGFTINFKGDEKYYTNYFYLEGTDETGTYYITNSSYSSQAVDITNLTFVSSMERRITNSIYFDGTNYFYYNGLSWKALTKDASQENGYIESFYTKIYTCVVDGTLPTYNLSNLINADADHGNYIVGKGMDKTKITTERTFKDYPFYMDSESTFAAATTASSKTNFDFESLLKQIYSTNNVEDKLVLLETYKIFIREVKETGDFSKPSILPGDDGQNTLTAAIFSGIESDNYFEFNYGSNLITAARKGNFTDKEGIYVFEIIEADAAGNYQSYFVFYRPWASKLTIAINYQNKLTINGKTSSANISHNEILSTGAIVNDIPTFDTDGNITNTNINVTSINSLNKYLVVTISKISYSQDDDGIETKSLALLGTRYLSPDDSFNENVIQSIYSPGSYEITIFDKASNTNFTFRINVASNSKITFNQDAEDRNKITAEYNEYTFIYSLKTTKLTIQNGVVSSLILERDEASTPISYSYAFVTPKTYTISVDENNAYIFNLVDNFGREITKMFSEQEMKSPAFYAEGSNDALDDNSSTGKQVSFKLNRLFYNDVTSNSITIGSSLISATITTSGTDQLVTFTYIPGVKTTITVSVTRRDGEFKSYTITLDTMLPTLIFQKSSGAGLITEEQNNGWEVKVEQSTGLSIILNSSGLSDFYADLQFEPANSEDEQIAIFRNIFNDISTKAYDQTGYYTLTLYRNVNNEIGPTVKYYFTIIDPLSTFFVVKANDTTLKASFVDLVEGGKTYIQYFANTNEFTVELNENYMLGFIGSDNKFIYDSQNKLITMGSTEQAFSTPSGTVYRFKIKSAAGAPVELEKYIQVTIVPAIAEFSIKLDGKDIYTTTQFYDDQTGEILITSTNGNVLKFETNVSSGNYITAHIYFRSLDNLTTAFEPTSLSAENIDIPLKEPGLFYIEFTDLAGNVMTFGNANNKYITVVNLSKITMSVEDQNFGIMDGLVVTPGTVFEIDNFNKFDSVSINAVKDGAQFGSYDTKTLKLEETGFYEITATGIVGTEEVGTVKYTIFVINPDSARLGFEYFLPSNYTITNVYQSAIGSDDKSIYPTSETNKLALSYNEGGNSHYTVFVEANHGGIRGTEKFSFEITIADGTPFIKANANFAETVRKTIVLSFNPRDIYLQQGSCKIVVRSRETGNETASFIVNAANAEDTIKTISISSEGMYDIQVWSESGETLFYWTSIGYKTPLNAVAIILIVIGSVVAAAGVVLFIVLRTKMKVR